jgi:1,4-alpha-glucan branching enzyme
MEPDTLQLVFDYGTLERIRNLEHHDPHSFLGAHPATVHGVTGVVVRALQPGAHGAFCLLAGSPVPVHMHALGGGVFAVFLPGQTLPIGYRFRFVAPTALAGSARTPTASCRRSASSTSSSWPRATTGGCGRSSERTSGSSTASPAPPSPSGRPRPGA